MKSKICQYLLPFFVVLISFETDAQTENSLFKMIPADRAPTTKPMRYYEVLCTKKGTVFISSTVGLIEDAGMMWSYPSYVAVNDEKKNIVRSYRAEDSIKSFCEGIGNCIFFVTHDNKIIWFPYDKNVGSWIPSFHFPPDQPDITVSKIWSDGEGTLFIGTERNSFYLVKDGANQENFPTTWDEVSDLGETEMGTRELKSVKKIFTVNNTGVFSFSQDPFNRNVIWVGTNHGLFRYNKMNNECIPILSLQPTADASITITNIEVDEKQHVWFSMGVLVICHCRSWHTCIWYCYMESECSKKTGTYKSKT